MGDVNSTGSCTRDDDKVGPRAAGAQGNSIVFGKDGGRSLLQIQILLLPSCDLGRTEECLSGTRGMGLSPAPTRLVG